MDFVQPHSPRDTEQHSLDHVWQAGIPYGRPFSHTAIDPEHLQNVPTTEPSIFHFQSVLSPDPGQSDLILPQPFTLGSAWQLEATALVRVSESDPENTSKIQNKQGLRHQVTSTSEWEPNTNAAVQATFQDSRPYSSEHISQFKGNICTSNITSYSIAITNPQPESDLLQTQPQSEFQGGINVFDTKRHSEQEWESVRARITSPRMYKARFSRWGLTKNFRRRDVISTLNRKRQRAAVGKGTVLYRNGKEIDIERYIKRAKITEYDLMDLSETDEVPRGVELRSPSPSNDSTTCYRVLQLRDTLLATFREALTGWKTATVKAPWTAARYHRINRATVQLDDSYKFLTDGRTRDFGIMLRLALAKITETFDTLSPTCVLSFVLGFHRFPHAGMSDVIWRYLTCLTREIYSEFHQVHLIFSSIYRLLQRHGFFVYQDFLTEFLPIIVNVMIKTSNIMDPFVVDSVLGLAVFFGNADKFQLQKILDGLKEAEVIAEASGDPLERLVIRSYIVEILAIIEDGTTKTSRLSFLEESLQHIEAVEKCDPTSQRINNLKTGCLASLASLHHIFCGNSSAIFNPRHELARHFMERAICDELVDYWAADPTNTPWKMDQLLEWHLEASDCVRVEDMRRRRDNALGLLQKLRGGLMGDDDSIANDVDSLRPTV